MKIRVAVIGLFLVLSFPAAAQVIANSWIDYDASRYYFRFDVSSTGLYRLTYANLSVALNGAGVNINNLDPRSFQIFGRGTEQYINVEGQSDGSFDNADFIEFFAQKNDGWLDEYQYGSAEEHTNPYYSLYNDTAAYYFTWYTDGSFSDHRYTTVPNSTPASLLLNYVWKEEVRFFNNVYQKGRDLGNGVPVGYYIPGKGWMSGNFGYNNGSNPVVLSHAFSAPNRFTSVGAPNARLKLAVAGVNRGAGGSEAHHVHVQINNGSGYQSVDDLLFGSYEYNVSQHSLAPSMLGNTTTVQLLTSAAISLINTTSDYSACAYITLSYPHNLQFNGEDRFLFSVPETIDPASFNATNFTTQSTTHLYDLDLHKRYEVNHNGSTGSVQCNIDPGAERICYLSALNAINTVSASAIVPVSGNGKFSDPQGWSAEDAYIIISHSKLMDEAQKYANYRSAEHNTVVIDIETLYDQFSYGIRKHPQSIRNFAHYAIEQWPTPPAFLFIIGKSIEEITVRKTNSYQQDNLVPSMGYPVSDALLTAGLNGGLPHVQAIPTGRLAARNNAEVAAYLAKMREFESTQNQQLNPYTIDNRQWQKHILHFAGGDNVSENTRFKNYLKSYENYAEDTLFGGKVFLFSKTSGNVIEQLNTDSVRLLLKQGAALMTFFGHASGNNFDLSVDDPSLWDNKSRYPVVIANSCFSGNIHKPLDDFGSVSEQYVLIPNEGAIAFMATPDLSFETNLNNYTREFYRQMSLARYGASIGEQMQAVNQFIPTDDQSTTAAYEMTLHGDPALKIYPHENAELTINDPVYRAAIKFEPAYISSDIDSFDVVLQLSNLGKATGKSFMVTATRLLPDQSETVLTHVVNGLSYDKTIRFRFATLPETGVGENSLNIQADLPLNIVKEHIETTNNIIANEKFNISSTDIFPVYPYDFAVVPDFNVVLKANTGYPFLEEQDYVMQIDTNDRYNALNLNTSINQGGAVLAWDPGLATGGFEDSTVFFWRVAPATDTSKWREFSFQVINGQRGWGQDHFMQFKHNAFDFLNHNRQSRRLEFTETSRELFVQVIGNPSPLSYNNNYYALDGQSAPLGEYGIASTLPGMAVVVIDPAKLKPWGTYGIGTSGIYENEDHRFGNNNDGDAHRKRVEYFFTFNVGDSVQMNSMVDMIQNHVDDGHYLLVYTQLRGLFDDINAWSDSHLDYFESLGADSIRMVGNQKPYIFFVKKGTPQSSREVIGEDANDVIRLTHKLISSMQLGEMNSPDIGPARHWTSFHYKEFSMDATAGDSAAAIVFASHQNGNRSATDTLIGSGQRSLDPLNNDSIRFLDLVHYTEDNVFSTPAQLNSWHVLYQPVPDVAINPRKGLFFPENNQGIAGVDLRFAVAVENISDFGMGKFRAHYRLTRPDGTEVAEQWIYHDSLAAGGLLMDTVLFETSGLSGRFTIYLEVNPQDAFWHPEQYHFNNKAYYGIEVLDDKKNPLLDVTFDGIHILSGDIVSPRPMIVMSLKDENEFLLMKDTNAFEVYLLHPSGMEKRIPFIAGGKEIMAFEPADDKNNKAKVSYRPESNLADGKYTLKVMGRDASGNKSGSNDYTIAFEVINKSTVTRVMNYPNPFSTSTRFVFTLTGSEIPDVFTIQIMTVTGKVVREISKSELGSIHIGNNVSEYAWDGRDEYGDRLANGVYLYRVLMQSNGEKIEHRETAADQFFVKEFGKMYLFR